MVIESVFAYLHGTDFGDFDFGISVDENGDTICSVGAELYIIAGAGVHFEANMSEIKNAIKQGYSNFKNNVIPKVEKIFGIGQKKCTE